MRGIFFLLGLLYLCSSTLSAQALRQDPLKVSLGLTAISYVGDMSETQSLFRQFHPGLNVSLQLQHERIFQLQVNGGFGKFADQYEGSWLPSAEEIEPLRFVETSIIYGDIRIKCRLFPNKRIHPYLSAGAGILYFNPKDQTGKNLVSRTQTRESDESFNSIVPQLPLSLGAEARLNSQLFLGLEYSFRYTPTDYLDNVGRLGAREGFDSLHSLLISLSFLVGHRPE